MFSPRPLTGVLFLSESMPLVDLLDNLVGPEALATWNRYRKHVGGEWDTLRATPPEVRKRLTSAGYLRRDGLAPDVFADLLRERGGSTVGPDPVAWYVRTALRALDERQAARRRAKELALARSTGHTTLFYHRDRLAKEAGFKSYYDYRMKSGWGDGHGRKLD